jgi:hypothetical protein
MSDYTGLSNSVFKFDFKSLSDAKGLQAKKNTDQSSNQPRDKYTEGKTVSGKSTNGVKVKGKIVAIDRDEDGKEVNQVQVLDRKTEEKHWVAVDQLDETSSATKILNFGEFLNEKEDLLEDKKRIQSIPKEIKLLKPIFLDGEPSAWRTIKVGKPEKQLSKGTDLKFSHVTVNGEDVTISYTYSDGVTEFDFIDLDNLTDEKAMQTNGKVSYYNGQTY